MRGTSPRPLVLRIGLVVGGRIVDERLIAREEAVTLGTETTNTFAVADASFPRQVLLFEPRRGVPHLTLPPGWVGRLSTGGQVRQLAPSDPPLALGPEMRGKLSRGDVSLLFQLVPAPAAWVEEARGFRSILSQLDGLLGAILLCSVFAHFGFVLYVKGLEPPPQPDMIEALAHHYPKLRVKPLNPPADPTPVPSEVGKAPKQVNPAPKAPRSEAEAKRPPDPARSREKVRAALSWLTARSDRGRPGLHPADILSQTAGDLDAVLKAGVPIDPHGAPGLQAGQVLVPGGQEIDGPTIGGKDPVIEARRPTGPRLDVEAAAVLEGALSAEAIQKTVRGYRKAIDTCHTRQLNTGAAAEGRIVVALVVDPSGAVVEARIVEDTTQADDLGQCLVLRMKRWKFPAFSGDAASFDLPLVFTAP